MAGARVRNDRLLDADLFSASRIDGLAEELDLGRR